MNLSLYFSNALSESFSIDFSIPFWPVYSSMAIKEVLKPMKKSSFSTSEIDS